jgi:hypothetical protein
LIGRFRHEHRRNAPAPGEHRRPPAA